MKYFWALLLSSRLAALDLNPHFDRKVQTETVETKESIVEIAGVKYRQIEYQGQHYLVDFREPESTMGCKRIAYLPKNYAVEAEVKITRRASLFLESLRQHCDPDADQIVTDPQLTNGNEKKVFVNPLLKKAGVGASF